MPHTTPWTGFYSEGSTVDLIMPATYGGYIWNHWSDTDPNRMKTVVIDTNITLSGIFIPVSPPPPPSVGGKATPINLPTNAIEAWTPWVGIVFLIAVAATSIAIIKHRKKQ